MKIDGPTIKIKIHSSYITGAAKYNSKDILDWCKEMGVMASPGYGIVVDSPINPWYDKLMTIWEVSEEHSTLFMLKWN